MSFEFNDLNAQLLPDLEAQLCRRPSVIACLCLSRPLLTYYCRCVSRPIITLPCICISRPILTKLPTEVVACGITVIEHIVDIARELVNPAELAVLRAELDAAIKHVEVQREVLERTTAPQSDEAFDAAETQLKQQLELLQRQRAEYRKQGGGGGKGGSKK